MPKKKSLELAIKELDLLEYASNTQGDIISRHNLGTLEEKNAFEGLIKLGYFKLINSGLGNYQRTPKGKKYAQSVLNFINKYQAGSLTKH